MYLLRLYKLEFDKSVKIVGVGKEHNLFQNEKIRTVGEAGKITKNLLFQRSRDSVTENYMQQVP